MKRKQVLLLHYAGEKINDIFNTLSDTDYQKSVDAITAHFTPTANSEFSIYCLWQAKQQPNEMLDTFHIRLQLANTYSLTDTNKEVKTQTTQAWSSRELHRNALQHPVFPFKPFGCQ